MQSHQNNKILLNGEIFCTVSVFKFKFKLLKIFSSSLALTTFQVLDSHLAKGYHIGQHGSTAPAMIDPCTSHPLPAFHLRSS